VAAGLPKSLWCRAPAQQLIKARGPSGGWLARGALHAHKHRGLPGFIALCLEAPACAEQVGSSPCGAAVLWLLPSPCHSNEGGITMGTRGRSRGQCLLGSHPLEDTVCSLVEHLQGDVELISKSGKEEDLFFTCRVDRTRQHRLELPPERCQMDSRNFRAL